MFFSFHDVFDMSFFQYLFVVVFLSSFLCKRYELVHDMGLSSAGGKYIFASDMTAKLHSLISIYSRHLGFACFEYRLSRSENLIPVQT